MHLSMRTLVDPIAAVTSSNPGSIYGELTRHKALVWSDAIEMWVAAHADVVREVLAHPDCLVRPSGEPIPPRLIGTTAGVVFGRLARMNDGDYHNRGKRAISRSLDSIALVQLRADALHRSTVIANQRDLSQFGFEFPVHVIGHLLGVPDAELQLLTNWTQAFVRCLVPAATDDEVTTGIEGADDLWNLFSELLSKGDPPQFLASLAQALEDAGVHGADAVIANAIGLLFQTHDAAAGLIGNTIVHLSRHPQALDSSKPPESQARGIVAHVSHNDASIQNTRRFVANDATIAGRSVPAGDAILVVLAAANDDEGIDSLSFGYGQHACPGRPIALVITEVAVSALLQRGLIPIELPSPMLYQSSTNARVPILDCPVQRPAMENAR
jgi:cytochrome P450